MFFIIGLFIQISFTSIMSKTIYPCLINATCGCSAKPATLSRIIGGEEVQDSSWGWMVSIRSGKNHICGGSLVASDLVISAAHCFISSTSLSNLRVTAGSNYLSKIDQQRSIDKLYLHLNYDSVKYLNDLAIVRLSSPFQLSNHQLALICLPTVNLMMINTNAIAIGWGVTTTTKSTVKNSPSNVLRQVTLNIIDNNDNACVSVIHNNTVQLCAAGDSQSEKDTCQGDSGGPLMVYIDQQWYLLGITSYGRGCALSTFAGVYTRVTAYQKVIECVMTNDTVCISETFLIRNSVASSFSCLYINIFFIILIQLT